MTNTSIFTGWLHSKQLPMLLSVMLIALAAMQSLHDQADHATLCSASQCELCLLNHNTEAGLIPFAINLSTNLVEQAPEHFLPLVLSLARNYSQPVRAPPAVYSL